MASIFARTVILYFLLSVIIKMMGKRQIGELEVSELVSTLLLSEVAAIPIADPDLPLLNALIPVLFIFTAEILISYFKNRSAKIKSAVEGEPVYLIYRGKLRQNTLKANRISVNELMSELRILGYPLISDIYYAILEPNGKLSVVPVAEESPLCHGNMETPATSYMEHALIIDGDVRQKTLTALGYDETWLKKATQTYHLSIKDVFLLTVDDDGKTSLIEKEEI